MWKQNIWDFLHSPKRKFSESLTQHNFISPHFWSNFQPMPSDPFRLFLLFAVMLGVYCAYSFPERPNSASFLVTDFPIRRHVQSLRKAFRNGFGYVKQSCWGDQSCKPVQHWTVGEKASLEGCLNLSYDLQLLPWTEPQISGATWCYLAVLWVAYHKILLVIRHWL